jgi:hypothetical protein
VRHEVKDKTTFIEFLDFCRRGGCFTPSVSIGLPYIMQYSMNVFRRFSADPAAMFEFYG